MMFLLYACSGEQRHCEVRKVNSTTLPPYWEWVQHAKYMGKIEKGGMTLDIWGYHVSNLCMRIAKRLKLWFLFQGPGIFIDLLVESTSVNIPCFLNASLGSGIRKVFFIDFTATTPPESDFTIPEICQQYMRQSC